MENTQIQLKYCHKTSQLTHEDSITLVDDLKYHQIQQKLLEYYTNSLEHPYLICPVYINTQKDPKGIIAGKWGKQLSTLSQAYIESYVKEAWLADVLRIYVGLQDKWPVITKENIYIDSNEPPKCIVTSCCKGQKEYVQNFKITISIIFKSSKQIISSVEKINSMQDVSEWLNEIRPQIEAHSITKLAELRAALTKPTNTHKIQLSEEQKEWIFSKIGQQPQSKMTLVYDGQKNHFDPTLLLQVANKQQLLFIIENNKGKRVVFWMAAKPEINVSNLFGTYYADKSKQSVLLGLEKKSVHILQDENSSVGLGKEVLLSIGKVDIVLSAFNCSNVSYFPCSYQADEEKGIKSSEDLLGMDFTLKQFEAYKIN